VTGDDPVIRVSDLGKRYRIGAPAADHGRGGRAGGRLRLRRRRDPELWAVREVSFEVRPGEVLGVVGANGAGKSTLLRMLSGITDPTEGRAEIRGRVGSLLEVGTGFHPELSGRDNVYLNGAILGMKRAEIRARFDDIVEFSGIERFLDTPVKRYSSGMYVRLAFAVAAHLDPEILLVDEVLAVGDLDFQRRCLGRMDEVANSGRTILFVSHNLASVAALCNRAILLESGRLVAEGRTDDVLQRYVSSTETQAGLSVRDRTDRQGAGPLRFTHVRVSGTAGPPVVGQDASIDLDYEAPHELGNVFVSFSVYASMGDVVFHCSNRVSGQEIGRAPAAGTFRCTIPRLPLMPGRYSVNVYSEVNGSPADWVQGATFFDVMQGDFFGSGQLPPEGHGRVVVEHGWEVESRTIDAASVGSGT
jgi:lipopolysaccharide transport system ATP-binding protein